MIESDDRMAFYKYIGSRLRHFRTQAGLNQSDIAEFLNLSSAQYQKYESASNKVPLDIVITLCRHFKVPVDEVVPTIHSSGAAPSFMMDMEPSAPLQEVGEQDGIAATEVVRINTAFAKIQSAKQRLILIELLESFSQGTESAA